MTTREALQREIDGTRGRLFGVSFFKADGSLRHMVCRTGVRRYLQGGDPSYNARERGNVVVYDVEIAATLPAEKRYKAYRSFKLDRVVRLSVNGNVFRKD